MNIHLHPLVRHQRSPATITELAIRLLAVWACALPNPPALAQPGLTPPGHQPPAGLVRTGQTGSPSGSATAVTLIPTNGLQVPISGCVDARLEARTAQSYRGKFGFEAFYDATLSQDPSRRFLQMDATETVDTYSPNYSTEVSIVSFYFNACLDRGETPPMYAGQARHEYFCWPIAGSLQLSSSASYSNVWGFSHAFQSQSASNTVCFFEPWDNPCSGRLCGFNDDYEYIYVYCATNDPYPPATVDRGGPHCLDREIHKLS